MTYRYHPGLSAPASQIVILDGGAHVRIFTCSWLPVCLLLSSLPSRACVDSIVITPAILLSGSSAPFPPVSPLSLTLGHIQPFFFSPSSLEENPSNLKNVASRNTWHPTSSGPTGWLCNGSPCLGNLFPVASFASYLFLPVWQTSPCASLPFADLLCALSL